MQDNWVDRKEISKFGYLVTIAWRLDKNIHQSFFAQTEIL